MSTRRAFFASATAFLAALATRRRARAMELDGPISHPIDAPPTLKLETIGWDHTPMYGGPSNAVVATPTDLVPGERLPLIVLLPGGAHNMQGPTTGYWGWWSEYLLADTDVALRRGVLTEKDFQNLVLPDQLARFNQRLASTPYRGAIYVTPWCVGRQLDPSPHGHMVADFLREAVARVRAEKPVIPTREATGLGGMSSGGLWALYSGALCADLFGTVVAEQPFTDDLVQPIHDVVVARSMPQRVRMVTSTDDHQKKTTTALYESLRADGIAVDFGEYPGAHSVQFAAGPGGLDAMLYFDRALRGEDMDGRRPLPEHDGLVQEMVVRPDRSRPPLDGKRSRPPLDGKSSSSSSSISTIAWTSAGLAALATAFAWARARRRSAAAAAAAPTTPNDDSIPIEVDDSV